MFPMDIGTGREIRIGSEHETQLRQNSVHYTSPKWLLFRSFNIPAMIRDFIALIYPNLCASCDRALTKQESCICPFCRYELPKTNYHLDDKNPVSKLFWGRAPLHSATAFYHFSKGGNVQRLMHELKYRGNQQVGFEVGQMMGTTLKTAPE